MKNVSKIPIIILHGWGKTGDAYIEIQKIFEKEGYKVFAPDMPGFGKEPLLKPVMNINDYVQFVLHFLKKHKLKKVILIGHSFGGRVSAKFAVTYPQLVDKIIFTGSPLIRPKFSLKKRIVQKIIVKSQLFIHFVPQFLQRFVRWGIYRFIGEFDYYKAQKLKETFKNIINEDPPSSSYIHKIKTKTLVLWGEDDALALVEYGKKIAEKIPNAKFISLPNEGHKLPYENPREFAKIVLDFLKNNG